MPEDNATSQQKPGFDPLEVLFEILRSKDGVVLAEDLLSVSTKVPDSLVEVLRASTLYVNLLKPEIWGNNFLQGSKANTTISEFREFWAQQRIEETSQASGRSSARSTGSRRRLSRQHSIRTDSTKSIASQASDSPESQDLDTGTGWLFKLNGMEENALEIAIDELTWDEILDRLSQHFHLEGAVKVFLCDSNEEFSRKEELHGDWFRVEGEKKGCNPVMAKPKAQRVSKSEVISFSKPIQETISVLLNRFIKARGGAVLDRDFHKNLATLSRGRKVDSMRMDAIFQAATTLRIIPTLSRSQLRILIDVIDSKNIGTIKKRDFLILAAHWYSACTLTTNRPKQPQARIHGIASKRFSKLDVPRKGDNTDLKHTPESLQGNAEEFSPNNNNIEEVLECASNSLASNPTQLEIARLSEALAKTASNPELSTNLRGRAGALLAHARFLLGDCVTPKDDFKRAIELNHTVLETFLLYGQYLLNTGDFCEAGDQFMHALLLEENSVSGLLGYAEVLACSTTGKSAKAEHYFQRAIEESESNPSLLSAALSKYALYKR